MRFILGILLLFVALTTFAQDLEVKKFEQLFKDHTAVMSPRKDINGTACGLVRVALKEPGAEFEGNIMGKVEYTGEEYLVYLTSGTKRLGIKHPDYLPTTIVFADYGTKKIISNITYQLKLKTNKKTAKVDKSKKGIAVFNIKPTNAMLIIDDQVADGSGGAYTLSLPYGTHYYTVKLKNFSLSNQMFKVDKNARNINVDLTEFLAKVEVRCKTEDAEIIINNEQIGLSYWKGIVVPGKYIVEARKGGFHTLSKSFNLIDGDSINIFFPALKAITGSLRVENELENCDVFLNNEKVGKTPWVNKELPIGEYNVEVRHDFYTPLKRSVIINEDQELVLNEKLSQTQIDKLFMCAENGDPKAYLLLAELYLYGSEYVRKERMWGNLVDLEESPIYFIDRNKFLEEGVIVNIDVEKSSFWAKKLADVNKSRIDFFTDIGHLSDMIMTRYLLGKGTKQDFYQSFFWANMSYKRKMTIINQFWVAWHLYYGKGVERNTSKALSILNNLRYLDSDDKGPYMSCNKKLFARLFKELGDIMFMGDGVPNYEDDLLKLIESY